MSDRQPLLREVRIRNYKSIESCQIRLGAFTLLVGRNGSGKSNFLDAIRFVADTLQNSIHSAIGSRGGVSSVLYRDYEFPGDFSIGVTVDLSENRSARFGFRVKISWKQKTRPVPRIKERLEIVDESFTRLASYEAWNGHVIRSSVSLMPPGGASDRLYLASAAALPEFREVYDALSSMGFYNINPVVIRTPQIPDASDYLKHDGSNIASVFDRLEEGSPEAAARITRYLSAAIPDLSQIRRIALGPTETIEFEQKVGQRIRKFYATSMSDGTLRALGALVAVAQVTNQGRAMGFVGIEEPETALHPAASGALMDALRESTDRTQVLVTTHSADLLDAGDPETDTLLGAESRDGISRIATLDAASLQQIRDHLYSPGELLRMDQLGLDEEDISRQIQSEPFESFEKSP